jgi:hypothetical protein
MGSKSTYRTMKSSQNIQKGSGTKIKKKEENTLDTISKSLLKGLNTSGYILTSLL